jgi:hypothetical protein
MSIQGIAGAVALLMVSNTWQDISLRLRMLSNRVAPQHGSMAQSMLVAECGTVPPA